MTIAVRNDNKTPLVVPPSIRRKAGFKSGQVLEVKAAGGVITILAKPPSADDEYTAAERRTVDARLAKADADIEAGRVSGPFATANEMAASIEASIKRASAKKPRASTKR